MKTRCLILFIPLFLLGCQKSDNTLIEEHGVINFDELIFGTYLVYYKNYINPLETPCTSPVYQSIDEVNTTGISFNNLNLIFEYKEDDKYVFKYSNGPLGYETHYRLWYFSCSDSIVYEESYFGGVVGYGKKVNGKNCPNSPPSDFEPIYCDQGPDNVYCFTSIHTKTNIGLGTIPEIKYLSTDSVNQTLSIGIPEKLAITVPTDSSFKLLPGEYWIGQIPSGGEPILGLNIMKVYEWSISLQGFEEGFLNVNKSGETYTLSFNFTCSGNAKWTGYYQGEIN